MLLLDKKEVVKNYEISKKQYASVCNSCACGGGLGTCNSTCKGCKDKGENIKEIRDIYKVDK